MVDPAYLIGFGGAIGALSRYGTNRALAECLGDHAFPAGTFTVNVIGSFVLAFVTFLSASDAVLYVVGTGACGSYTTFSSFSVDTIQLWEENRELMAATYAAVNLIGAFVGIGFAWVLANNI